MYMLIKNLRKLNKVLKKLKKLQIMNCLNQLLLVIVIQIPIYLIKSNSLIPKIEEIIVKKKNVSNLKLKFENK